MKEFITQYPELEKINHLLRYGGSKPENFSNLEELFQQLYLKTPPKEIPRLTQTIHESFGVEVVHNTVHGFAYRKPHGYAGDFEIIDKTYRQEVHPSPKYAIWDEFYHSISAARAVRNRKTYFKELIRNTKQTGQNLQVLNIASGPCRDLLEWFEEEDHGNPEVFFDCVELDPNAITFAKALNHAYLYNLHFIQKNIFRFRPEKQYDLIWSAGLFDYFTDKIFVKLLRRMRKWVRPGGSIVIGNFSTYNPSQGYMMIMTDWPLQLRSRKRLLTLAEKAGFAKGEIKVENEPENVNLFLNVQVTKSFIKSHRNILDY